MRQSISNYIRPVISAAALALGGLGFSGAASALPVGWTCQGNCGEIAPNGVVTESSPGAGNHLYVSSSSGVLGLGLGVGAERNGSAARSNLFSGASGDKLEFSFNYVTTDGAGFADYAWVQLLNNDDSVFATLFTARTITSGDTVPGFGLPGLSPGVTLIPASTPIIGGAPTWSPVGSGCFASGCGYTGWIDMEYVLPNDGDFRLLFGVVNWSDTAFDSGLAFDGILIAGTPIDQTVPEPATLLLVGSALAGMTLLRRRRKA